MKLTLIFSVAFLAVAQCASVAVDPTKVCMPNRFQSQYYDAKTLDSGNIAVDFKKQIVARVYASTGTRIVLDFKKNATYTIEKDDTCTKKPLSPTARKSVFQCLPAGAQPIPDPIKLGLKSKSMLIQSWIIDYGEGNVVKYAFNTDKPAIPVLRQAVEGTTDLGMIVYVNPSLDVDPALLNIPASCPKSTTLLF